MFTRYFAQSKLLPNLAGLWHRAIYWPKLENEAQTKEWATLLQTIAQGLPLSGVHAPLTPCARR
jgi:hypothetical protein